MAVTNMPGQRDRDGHRDARSFSSAPASSCRCFRKYIASEVRITSYILIIATFVTLADMILAAVVPDIRKALGPFIPLIVANCLLLGRAEAFAAKVPAEAVPWPMASAWARDSRMALALHQCDSRGTRKRLAARLPRSSGRGSSRGSSW